METNICVAGFGGQGVMTIGKFLAQAVCEATDLNTVFFPTYGAEQRGRRVCSHKYLRIYRGCQAGKH